MTGLANKTAKLLFLGLDNAGKTTLLCRLKGDTLVQAAPTLHPTSNELCLGNVTFTAFDLGGHAQAVDAVVFIVDAADHARFPECKAEIDGLLLDETTRDCPICILGNKIDIPSAVSQEQLCDVLGLAGQLTGKCASHALENGRPIEIFMCSIATKSGYGAGLRWISEYI